MSIKVCATTIVRVFLFLEAYTFYFTSLMWCTSFKMPLEICLKVEYFCAYSAKKYSLLRMYIIKMLLDMSLMLEFFFTQGTRKHHFILVSMPNMPQEIFFPFELFGAFNA